MNVSFLVVIVVASVAIAVIALVIALVANQRAAREEAGADIPGLDLAPPDSTEVWRNRSRGPDGTTYIRAYATTLSEADVDAFYTEALADLGYERTGGSRPGEVSPLQTILGDYARSDTTYRVSIAQTPHTVAGREIAGDWAHVAYTTVTH